MSDKKDTKSKSREETSILIRFFSVLRKHIFAMICSFLIVVIGVTGFSLFKCRTVYTAKEKVIFITNIYPSGASSVSSSNVTTDVSLAVMYLPQVKSIIVNNSAFIEFANSYYYGEGVIASNAINIEYGESSLIFTVSYTDETEELAKSKLKTLVKSATMFLSPSGEGSKLIQASEIGLKPVQNEPTVLPSNNFIKYEAFGFLAALLLSVVFALFLDLVDNKISNEQDLEEITGVSLLAYIEDFEKR